MSGELVKVATWICLPCLQGDAGECHVPGCCYWMSGDNDRPDLAEIDDRGMLDRLSRTWSDAGSSQQTGAPTE